MSPSRRRGRHQAVVPRDRRELAVAVIGSAAVVLVTLLLIWLMRPGSNASANPGKGGILVRQPRVGWLVFLAIVAVLGVIAWLRRPRSRVRDPRVFGAGAIASVAVVAIAVAVLWPHGILRHYPSLPHVTTPVTTVRRPTPTPKSSTTIAPGTTTAVSTTTPPTTGPTTTTGG